MENAAPAAITVHGIPTAPSARPCTPASRSQGRTNDATEEERDEDTRLAPDARPGRNGDDRGGGLHRRVAGRGQGRRGPAPIVLRLAEGAADSSTDLAVAEFVQRVSELSGGDLQIQLLP